MPLTRKFHNSLWLWRLTISNSHVGIFRLASGEDAEACLIEAVRRSVGG